MTVFLLIAGCITNHEPLVDNDEDGYSEEEGDCDDSDPSVSPEAPEVCNGIDDDCDGDIDVGAVDIGGWFPDADGDGYGDDDLESTDCDVPEDWIAQGGDCDDTDASISPDGVETCNSSDDDCDGEVDEDAVDMPSWFEDADGDGYGRADKTRDACLQPSGTAGDAGDCDDTDATISPGAEEVCNDGIDNNCNGDTADCGWATFVDLTQEMRIYGSYDGSLSRGIAIGDITGNNQNELVLGAYFALDPRDNKRDGMIAVFDSPITKETQTSSQADLQIWGDEDGLGQSVAIGDFDNDGYDDLLVSAFSWDGSTQSVGRSFVVYGPVTTGFEMIDGNDWELRGIWEFERMGQYSHNLGDLDDNGTDDFLLASPFGDYDDVASPGSAHLVTDAKSGLGYAVDAAAVTLWGNDEFDYFGYGAHSLDLNGDGSLEVLISASGTENGDGAVYSYAGLASKSGLLSGYDADTTWAGESNSTTGVALDVCDCNGDGRDDFVVVGKTAQDGSAYMVFGEPSPSGHALSDAAVTIRGENQPRQLFSVLTEDFNGDGAADILLGEDNGPPASLYAFYGPFGEQATLYTDEADVLLTADLDGDRDFPTFAFGDVTGDGVGDPIIGSRYGDGGNGVAYILPGLQ